MISCWERVTRSTYGDEFVDELLSNGSTTWNSHNYKELALKLQPLDFETFGTYQPDALCASDCFVFAQLFSRKCTLLDIQPIYLISRDIEEMPFEYVEGSTKDTRGAVPQDYFSWPLSQSRYENHVPKKLLSDLACRALQRWKPCRVHVFRADTRRSVTFTLDEFEVWSVRPDGQGIAAVARSDLHPLPEINFGEGRYAGLEFWFELRPQYPEPGMEGPGYLWLKIKRAALARDQPFFTWMKHERDLLDIGSIKFRFGNATCSYTVWGPDGREGWLEDPDDIVKHLKGLKWE